MIDTTELWKYNIKPAVDLAYQGEFGFLLGTVLEKCIEWNPYLQYRRWTGQSSIVTRQIQNHPMQIDISDRGISRHLFIRGIHEPEATDAFRAALERVRNDSDEEVIVLEVGANLGYYVLEEARILGRNSRIFAFEPDPENRELLERNVAQNGYDDFVEILPYAVDSKSGVGTFCQSTHSNWGGLADGTDEGTRQFTTKTFDVETTSVDDFLTEKDIEPSEIDVLRMDLEGHEVSVMRGMTKVLEHGSSLLVFIEYHPDSVGKTEYEWAISQLERHGLQIEFVNQKWNVLDCDSFDKLKRINGSHVRVIASRRGEQ